MKRTLSLLLALALLLTCLPTRASAASAFQGYTPISTKEALSAIRDDLGGKYYLTADIVFTADDFAPGGAFYNNGGFWTPIGTEDAPFTGILDGNGHTITGLRVNLKKYGRAYGGLFGYVSSAGSEYGIFNLGMVASNIQVTSTGANAYGGAIAGYCENGTIDGCFNTGSVTATQGTYGYGYCGGIVGSKQYGSVTRCYSTGPLSGGGTLGGIAGSSNFASFRNCFTTSSFSGQYAGGIVGYATSSTLQYCYSTGNYTSSDIYCAGGIAGINMNTTVEGCYYTASTFAGGGTQTTDSALQSQATFSGFDFDRVWTMGSGDFPYPQLQGVPLNTQRYALSIAISALPEKSVYTQGETTLDLTGGQLTVTYSSGGPATVSMDGAAVSGFDGSKTGDQTVTVTYEGCTATFTVTVLAENTTDFLGGIGTADNPYLISNTTHLDNVRNYPDAHFMLVCDISCDGLAWTPIGTLDSPFTGSFDGGGHTLTGLTVSVSASGKATAGLFGAIENAEIRGLHLSGGSVTLSASERAFAGGIVGYGVDSTLLDCSSSLSVSITASGKENFSYCGGIAGFLSGSAVGNCRNSGSVTASTTTSTKKSSTASSLVGGIVGSATDCRIYGCANTGICTGYACGITSSSSYYSYYSVRALVGGIVGTTTGSVTDCHNTGTVQGSTDVYHSTSTRKKDGYLMLGGIAGKSEGLVERCYNTGTCIATDDTYNKWLGGIAGTGTDIKNCFQAGTLENQAEATGSSMQYYAGGIAGSLGGTAEACYSLTDDLFGKKVSATVISCYDPAGTESGTLTQPEAFTGFDFDSVWTLGSGEYPYPVLEPISLPWELTGITLLSPPATTVYLLGSDTLDLTGAELSLLYNGSIPGRTVPVTADMVTGFDVSTPAEQTVTVTYGGFTAQFTVTVMAEDTAHFAGGIGSARHPYLIQTEAQLKNITLFPGAYYALTADLRLTAENWVPIPTFSGTLEGNGHVIRGLRITSCSGDVGLFAENRGTLQRIGLEGSIAVARLNGAAGSFAGSNYGRIQECYSAVDITVSAKSERSYSYPGGYTTTMRSCYAGGIAGRSEGIILNCYNTGSITAAALEESYNNACGEAIAAGIAVWGMDGISLCYNIGSLQATTEKASQRAETWGIANQFTNSYSGLGDAMLEMATYEGFDFANVWGMDPFSGYPYPQLKWQLKKIVSLSLVTAPAAPIETVEGLWPDVSGVTVRATYADGTEKAIALTPALLSGLDITQVGTQEVNVTCGGAASQQTLTFIIKAKEPVKLELTTPPQKLSYVQGQPLALEGGVLTLTYSNASTQQLDLTQAQISYDADAVGTVTVKAAYGGLEATFAITVAEKVAKKVVLTQPDKLSYFQGEALDLTGGSVTVTYVSEDDYTQTLPLTLSMISGYDSSAVGIQTLTFRYLEHSETFVVRVVKKQALSVVLTALPAKLSYFGKKEALDLTGGQVSVSYNDGSTQVLPLTEEMVFGFDNTVAGKQTLTVMIDNAQAVFEVEITTATVEFRDEDGSLLSSGEYMYGDAVTVPADPEKEPDSTYAYRFAGWDREVTVCQGDATYTARYEASYIAYTVEFRDWDGTVLSSAVYHWGDAVAAPADPERDPDDTYSYTFSGWDREVTVCQGDATYTATYQADEIGYRVVFLDWDGTVICDAEYRLGDRVTVPADPEREPDNTYTYRFAGWDREVTVCQGDATYTARYEASYIEYTVTFQNYDFTVLSTATYHWGDTITVPADPEKPSANPDAFTFTFSGWGEAVTVCQGDATYTARYDIVYKTYTVTFLNWDGTVLSSRSYHWDDPVRSPDYLARRPEEAGIAYTFAGWDREVTNCMGDAVYTATYTEEKVLYTVVFLDWDGSELGRLECHWGDEITPPANPYRPPEGTAVYVFLGWGDLGPCEDNAQYYAQYGCTSFGDVNYDGQVNSKDRTALARYLANWPDYPREAIAIEASDVNSDGVVNGKDRTVLARHLANWPTYTRLPLTPTQNNLSTPRP